MILPGPYTDASKREVDAWQSQVAQNKFMLEFLAAQRASPKFEAAVTGYDSATGRYSWYEQDIDENGQRYQQPGGRYGDSTMNPAYGVGDGSIIGQFPVPVVLRERGLHTVGGQFLGMAYEFPLYCACAGGGSGGGSYIFTECCPVPIPSTLCVTFSSPGGCIDGLSATLTSGAVFGIPWIWAVSGSFVAGCIGLGDMLLRCLTTSPGVSVWDFGITWVAGQDFCRIANFTTGPSSMSCSPFLLTFDGITTTIPPGIGGPGAPCPSVGVAYTATITECP